MPCKICGAKSGFYPLCRKCNLKSQNEKTSAFTVCETDNEDNFRSKFPCTIRADDGHMVRSKAELIVDNWLYKNKIVHAYERKVPVEEKLYCDFFLPYGEGVWIEVWGLEEQKYLERKELKKKLYNRHNKKLIELADKETKNLDDILPQKLRPFLPPGFSFV